MYVYIYKIIIIVVVIISIFVVVIVSLDMLKTEVDFFRFLWLIESSEEQHLFEI